MHPGRIKQQEPVRTNRQGECLTLLLALGQAVILDPAPVPLKPDRLGDAAQPVRHDRGQVVQRRAKRLGHQFEQVQIVHGGQHVRAVGALLATGPDQATRLEALEHGVQQPVFCPSRDKAGAELGEYAEVKAGVGQIEPERVFPVNPAAHGIGSLAITEVLEELEDRDQGQTPCR